MRGTHFFHLDGYFSAHRYWSSIQDRLLNHHFTIRRSVWCAMRAPFSFNRFATVSVAFFPETIIEEKKYGYFMQDGAITHLIIPLIF
jgi:hypothetical protein